MKNWIAKLNEVRVQAKKTVEEINIAKRAAAIPKRIRTFDNEGDIALRHHVTADLDEIYACDEDFNMNQHLINARAVGGNLSARKFCNIILF